MPASAVMTGLWTESQGTGAERILLHVAALGQAYRPTLLRFVALQTRAGGRARPEGRLLELAGAGHAPFLSHGAELAERVHAFLSP